MTTIADYLTSAVLASLGVISELLGGIAWPSFGLGAISGLVLGVAVTILVSAYIVRRRAERLADQAAADLGAMLSRLSGQAGEAASPSVAPRQGW